MFETEVRLSNGKLFLIHYDLRTDTDGDIYPILQGTFVIHEDNTEEVYKPSLEESDDICDLILTRHMETV